MLKRHWPCRRLSHATAILNGIVYMFGGLSDTGLVRKDLFR